MLFKELKIYLATPPVLWCDDLSALALAFNLVFHAKTKHIEVDYHFVRENVLNWDILLKFISTHDQATNLLTKGLPSSQFFALKSKLLVVLTPINWQRGGGRGVVLKDIKLQCDQAQSHCDRAQVSDMTRSQTNRGGLSQDKTWPLGHDQISDMTRSRTNRGCLSLDKPRRSQLLKPRILRLLNSASPAMAYIFHMRLITHACKAQSRSCRKAESQYGKIHYISQPPMTAWKETLRVPMYYNSVVCRRK